MATKGKLKDALKVKIKDGYLIATRSPDPDYPGIDIEYVTNDESQELSQPRVLIECPKETNILRCLIWDDPNNEDYSEEIIIKRV